MGTEADRRAVIDTAGCAGHKISMGFFPEYRPSADTFREHVDRARWLGLVPLFLSMMLMFAAPAGPGPGLWSAFGTLVGFHLLLGGSTRLARESSRPSARAADRWFPLLLFAVQTGFGIVTAVLIWRTLRDLGHHSSPAEEVVFYALLAGFPAHRLIRVRAPGEEAGRRRLRWELFFRYLTRGLTAILLSLLLTDLMRDPAGKIGQGGIILSIALWVTTVLFVLGCVTFFIERALVASGPVQSSRSETAPPGES